MTPKTRKGYYCPQCNGPVDAEDSICLGCNAERHGAWPVDPYVGRTIGRKYRIDRRLASGASGLVFESTQVHQNTELGNVIVKMLPKQATKDPKISERFMNEARAARTLTNPHVVRIFDLDFDAGHVPYLVQEHVEGESLDEIILQEGRLPPARALAMAIQIAEGMEEAHAKQILHRNLQPGNVIVRERKNEDFVKIIGFGLYQPVTQTGGLKKTGGERHLAPEQAGGRSEDERTDIYALGLIFYEMLTGQLPEEDGKRLAQLVPDADTNLTDIVEMLLESDPADRPESMKKVMTLLEQAAEELGLNLDITGRFTVPPQASEQSLAPTSTPPELPHGHAAGRRPGRGRIHPGIVALAVCAGLILLAAVVLGAVRACSKQDEIEPEVPAEHTDEPVQAPEPDVEEPAPEPEVEPEPEPPAPQVEEPVAPAVKRQPPPAKKKPLPGKKKTQTPWTKI